MDTKFSLPKLKNVRRKVAVVGFSSSGKTVFLTSLINHLSEHNPNLFKIDNSGTSEIRKFKCKSTATPFNYEKHRSTLINSHIWPEKTNSFSTYKCTFEPSHWLLTKARLTLVDLPGEYFADIQMAIQSDFHDWSNFMLKQMLENPDQCQFTKDYLNYVTKTSGVFKYQTALVKYKQLLLNLYKSYKPVTPSSFIISPKGKVLFPDKYESDAEIFDQHFSGIDAAQEFIPLPKSILDSSDSLANHMMKNYSNYRKKVVIPWCKELAGCDRIVVVVDIPDLLCTNVSRYNDVRESINQIFDYLNPDHGGLFNIFRVGLNMALPSFLKWTRLTRAAFVATKADTVCEYHRDNLKILTEEMCRKISKNYDGLLTKVFSCSAICSTETLQDNALKGVLEGGSSEDVAFRISAVPNHWPDTWKEGDFTFSDVMPKWPARKDSPPKHLNMDAVYRYIMSEGLLE